MSYYFSKTIEMPMDKAVEHVSAVLADKGFGILTTIDVAATLKKTLDVGFRSYVILGACNPAFAYKALQQESRIGVMLPCNVILQQIDDSRIEVSAVDPVSSMQGVNNPGLSAIAGEVRDMLKQAVDEL